MSMHDFPEDKVSMAEMQFLCAVCQCDTARFLDEQQVFQRKNQEFRG